VEDIIWEFHEQKKLVDICKSLQTVNGYYFAYGKPHKNEEKLKFISKNIWKMANSYRLASSEQLDETSTWYMMDEVGNAVEHSENPNSIMSPFLFAPNNKLDENVISYSILWLTHDVKAGDIISRDYLCGIDESRGRISRLNVWFDLPKHPFYEKARAHNKLLAIKTVEGQEYIKKFPDLNEKEKAEQKTKNYNLPKSHPLKVITDNGLLIENLKSPNFAFTNDPKEADIIWLVANLTDNFEKFNGQFINQFPYEACIVMKHNLARTTYDGLGNVPWLQKTFNLDYELDSFVGEFKLREKNHQSNWWIIKPPNMARSMDMVVTDNLDAIIRVLETGPKLAQKYIHRPLTLRGKKIDLRFVIVLRSLEPLEVFIYKVFWIRTSNNTFSLDPRSLDTYETHFTVMNYGRKLEQIHFDEFIKDFNEENKEKNVKWDDVYQNIKIMVKELFLAVKRTHPQMHWPNARSVYGLDVMIDQHFQPKILEMTYSPDCGRACKYHPTFFEDLFNCLFRNEDEKTNVDKLF
jgi:tubulin--tyrosine ligase-like protein 12